MRSINCWRISCFCALILAGCAHRGPQVDVPAFPREFRAAWVATVVNIDWPSKAGLPVEQQQREIIQILDCAAELKLNAIVLQVRTCCDAFYPSELEPWSEYLTGVQGKAPEPFYDPLEMWVREAHQRGIELHAWLNPYRARHPAAKTPDAPMHVANTNPEVVRKFNGWEWLDPGEEFSRERTLAVFRDIVKRYDIDGVHMDDYFYPYPDYLKGQDFPDESAWQKYLDDGGKLSRDDWRRENVNRLVKDIYRVVHKEKKWVKFGISPFGIWRPGNPPVVAGFDQYAKLYADAKLWLNKGWCDYYTPQLYWKVTAASQPYPDLLDWWIGQNWRGRNIWPGNIPSRLGQVKNPWAVKDILDQVAVTRARPGASGNVHFSMKAFTLNYRGIVEALKEGPYRGPALVPASRWLDGKPPKEPEISFVMDGSDVVVKMKPRGREQTWQWTIYAYLGSNTWKLDLRPGHEREYRVRGTPRYIAIGAVDRCGNESRRVIIETNPPLRVAQAIQ